MSVCVRMMLNTAWDLLLSSFMLVAATVRDLFPSDIRVLISCQKCRHGIIKTSFFNKMTARYKRLLFGFPTKPCSWRRPYETDHQHMARKHCALSLSVHVDFYGEKKEKIMNSLLFRSHLHLFNWFSPSRGGNTYILLIFLLCLKNVVANISDSPLSPSNKYQKYKNCRIIFNLLALTFKLWFCSQISWGHFCFPKCFPYPLGSSRSRTFSL